MLATLINHPLQTIGGWLYFDHGHRWANALLGTTDWGEIPVVDPRAPELLVGIVTRRMLLAAFDRVLLDRETVTTPAEPPPSG